MNAINYFHAFTCNPLVLIVFNNLHGNLLFTVPNCANLCYAGAMLKVTRRHQPPCKRKMYDQGYTKCHCPVLIRGTLAGKRITLSAARFLRPPADRDLAPATRLARQWEADGEVRAALWEQPPEDPLPAAPAPAATSRTLIWYAISGWLRSRRARDIKPVSLRKFQTFARQLYAFTTARGYFYLDQITPEDMDQFYIEWKDGKAAKGNKL